jgi:hypothetical protein
MPNILRNGIELGPVITATEPVVERVIPIFMLGYSYPVGIVEHRRYSLTLAFELPVTGAYRVEGENGSWDVDAFILTGEDDRYWHYTCWSRVEKNTPAVEERS